MCPRGKGTNHKKKPNLRNSSSSDKIKNESQIPERKTPDLTRQGLFRKSEAETLRKPPEKISEESLVEEFKEINEYIKDFWERQSSSQLDEELDQQTNISQASIRSLLTKNEEMLKRAELKNMSLTMLGREGTFQTNLVGIKNYYKALQSIKEEKYAEYFESTSEQCLGILEQIEEFCNDKSGASDGDSKNTSSEYEILLDRHKTIFNDFCESKALVTKKEVYQNLLELKEDAKGHLEILEVSQRLQVLNLSKLEHDILHDIEYLSGVFGFIGHIGSFISKIIFNSRKYSEIIYNLNKRSKDIECKVNDLLGKCIENNFCDENGKCINNAFYDKNGKLSLKAREKYHTFLDLMKTTEEYLDSLSLILKEAIEQDTKQFTIILSQIDHIKRRDIENRKKSDILIKIENLLKDCVENDFCDKYGNCSNKAFYDDNGNLLPQAREEYRTFLDLMKTAEEYQDSLSRILDSSELAVAIDNDRELLIRTLEQFNNIIKNNISKMELNDDGIETISKSIETINKLADDCVEGKFCNKDGEWSNKAFYNDAGELLPQAREKYHTLLDLISTAENCLDTLIPHEIKAKRNVSSRFFGVA